MPPNRPLVKCLSTCLQSDALEADVTLAVVGRHTDPIIAGIAVGLTFTRRIQHELEAFIAKAGLRSDAFSKIAIIAADGLTHIAVSHLGLKPFLAFAQVGLDAVAVDASMAADRLATLFFALLVATITFTNVRSRTPTVIAVHAVWNAPAGKASISLLLGTK